MQTVTFQIMTEIGLSVLNNMQPEQADLHFLE